MQRRTLLALSGAPVLSAMSAASASLVFPEVAAAASPPSSTPWQPVPGQHYETLASPLATPAGPRVELVEFFWLGCGHCKAFDPVLEAWLAQRRETVALRRVHIAGRAQVAAHQNLFFALESLGLQEQLRPVVFDLLGRGTSMNSPQEQAAALAGSGVDKQGLIEACQSFGVAAKCQQANALQERAGVNGVPTLMVGGRFRTSPEMARSGAQITEADSGRRALAVVDHLIQKALRG